MEQFLYKPNTERAEYNFWMAYPACEAFALSSLGYMWLFKIASTLEGINAERVYTDTNTTCIKPQDVSSIAFSLSFDFDFMGVLELLEKYNIPIPIHYSSIFRCCRCYFCASNCSYSMRINR